MTCAHYQGLVPQQVVGKSGFVCGKHTSEVTVLHVTVMRTCSCICNIKIYCIICTVHVLKESIIIMYMCNIKIVVLTNLIDELYWYYVCIH